jgi:hypothetical protein
MRTTACMRFPVCGRIIFMGTACKIQPYELPWSPLLKVAFRLKNDCRAPLMGEDTLVIAISISFPEHVTPVMQAMQARNHCARSISFLFVVTCFASYIF